MATPHSYPQQIRATNTSSPRVSLGGFSFLKNLLFQYANDKSVKGEFVRLVLQSDLSDELKKQVLTCGIDALKGEDVI